MVGFLGSGRHLPHPAADGIRMPREPDSFERRLSDDVGVILEDALSRAQRLLDETVRREDHRSEVVIATCSEHEAAWVFGYQTRAFLASGAILDSLVGNGPVVVPKDGSAAYLAVSAFPVEDQLKAATTSRPKTV